MQEFSDRTQAGIWEHLRDFATKLTHAKTVRSSIPIMVGVMVYTEAYSDVSAASKQTSKT